MLVFKLCIFFTFLIFPLLTQADEDEIDPFDMINFDHASMSMKNQKKTKDSEELEEPPITKESKEEDLLPAPPPKPKPEIKIPIESLTDKPRSLKEPKIDITKCPVLKSPASPLFRQFVKSFLYHIKDKSSGEYDMRLILTMEEIDLLTRYGDSETETDLHSAHHILTKMMWTCREVSFDGKSSQHLWIEDKLGISIEKLVHVMILVALMIGLTTLLVYFKFTLRQMGLWLFLFIFMASVALTWYSLYKKEVSKQHYAISKDMPDYCKKRENRDAGFLSVTFSWISSSFTFQKDECLEYFEHLVIDPLVKVSPMEALAVTLTRFFVTPLAHIAEEMSKALRIFLKDLPVQLWPVALIGLSVFGFLFLFMGFGYRISVPLIAIEPSQNNNRNEIRALEGRLEREREEHNALMFEMQKNIQDMCRSTAGLPAITHADTGSSSNSPVNIGQGHLNDHNCEGQGRENNLSTKTDSKKGCDNSEKVKKSPKIPNIERAGDASSKPTKLPVCETDKKSPSYHPMSHPDSSLTIKNNKTSQLPVKKKTNHNAEIDPETVGRHENKEMLQNGSGDSHNSDSNVIKAVVNNGTNKSSDSEETSESNKSLQTTSGIQCTDACGDTHGRQNGRQNGNLE